MTGRGQFASRPSHGPTPLSVRHRCGLLPGSPASGTGQTPPTGLRNSAAGCVPRSRPSTGCPSGAQLLAELGADTVTCACGTLAVSLLAKRRERAAAADVLGTPGEISGALDRIGIKVSASTIRKWASRGRLAPRPGGVYALSDVLALCAARDTKARR
jgi:hypothetical protein